MRTRLFAATLGALGAAASANALTFECRWVERVGTIDTVIGGDGATIAVGGGSIHRIRLQFSVVNDAMGPAPAGGFVGWNVGRFDVSDPAHASTNTRTPGRLAPFTFQPGANGNPPLPGGDPFTHLTDIDATLGTQSPFWGCDANNNPLPQPAAVVRGRNTFVSVFEVTTTDPAAFNYQFVVSGNLIGETEWRAVGSPIPPDCANGVPGSVTYAPVPTVPVPFTCTLNLTDPAPGAACTMVVGALVNVRRRRHRRA